MATPTSQASSISGDPGVMLSRPEHFRRAVLQVLAEGKVIDLIPQTSKVIVLDSELQVQHAYFVLMSHGCNCGPVWDADRQRFIGLLSVSDFVDVLVNTWKEYKRRQQNAAHTTDSSMADEDPSAGPSNTSLDLKLPTQRICDWQLGIRARGSSIPFLLTVAPQASLLSAVRQLIASRVHRLAVAADPLSQTVAAIMTQHQLLGHLLRQCLQGAGLAGLGAGALATVGETGVGRRERLLTVCADTPVADAAEILIENRISSVPVVAGSWNDREDQSGHGVRTVVEGGKTKVLGTFARADVLLLSLMGVEESLKARVTIEQVMRERLSVDVTCKDTDTLVDVCKKLYAVDRHQVVCVDEEGCLMGVVALTDMLSFVLQCELSIQRDTTDHTHDMVNMVNMVNKT